MKTRLMAGAAALLLVSGFAVPAPAPLNRAEWADRARAEMLHSWRAYERHAWGFDELKPLSKTGHNWHAESLLMTPVDSLDTLLLMGLTEEAEKAKALIVEKLSFDKDFPVKNFEITIRLLGGLLSAYQMTGDPRLLKLADDLGTRLLGALHAFLPAVLALGGDLGRARDLQASAHRMWNLHGIEPEVLDYLEMKVRHAGYPLRPEIIESAYTLHRRTNDPRYLEMGRTYFEGLLAHCRTEAGYTTLKDMTTKEKGDLMPSYFLAETLKYLYLLFAPEKALDFDKVVFNTEAHPLQRTW